MNRRGSALAVMAVLTSCLVGCSTTSAPVTTRYVDWRTPILGDPAVLLLQGKAALDAKQPVVAYRYLASIRTLHPDSSEVDEAFELATYIFRNVFNHFRIQEPHSVWVEQEPTFLYEWASSYLRDDTFPQKQMDQLLASMPLFFLRDFQKFVAARPYSAHWALEVDSDNNRVEAVRGVPSRPSSSTPAP